MIDETGQDSSNERAKTYDPPLAHLQMLWVRFQGVALGPIRMGFELGTDLRGALGIRMREHVCATPDLNPCSCCTEESPCPYRLAFEVMHPPGRTITRRGDWLPRPFVVRPPLDSRRLTEGERFSFDILLFGPMVRCVSQVAGAFDTAQNTGLGGRTARFRLAEVHSLDQEARVIGSVSHREATRAETQRFAGITLTDSGLHEPVDSNANRAWIERSTRVTVRFLTPTFIKHRGNVEEVPSFEALVQRIGQRFRDLMLAWGEPPDVIITWPREAHRVTIEKWSGSWVLAGRESRRQSPNRQDLSGFVGEVTYRGPIQPFRRLLRVGELLHVGANPTFGCGWYHVLEGDEQRLHRTAWLDGSWPPPAAVRRGW